VRLLSPIPREIRDKTSGLHSGAFLIDGLLRYLSRYSFALARVRENQRKLVSGDHVQVVDAVSTMFDALRIV
jgi:hypothetical protein